MNTKDIDTLNYLTKRLDNLPNVLDLRIKRGWEKLTEEEHALELKAYQELDDILNDVLAFINVKFERRKDLIHLWNRIDFDPKIGGIKVHTNSQDLIREAWLSGLHQLSSLIKNMKREAVLLNDDNLNTRQSTGMEIKNSNIFYET